METAGETDDGHPGHRTANEQAGSIVLHVGHDMNEIKKNDEEADEPAAAKETHESNEDISKEGVEIRRLIEGRRTTPQEEKQRLKEVSKQIKKMHQGQKNEKTRKRRSHHVTERNCQCLWGFLQKNIRRQRTRRN